MVAKFCSRSHGQPVPGVRSAAMISISRAMSREASRASSERSQDDAIEGTPGADSTDVGLDQPRIRIRIRHIMEYLM